MKLGFSSVLLVLGVSLVHVLRLRFPGCRDLPDKWPDWKWILSTDAVV